MATLLLAGCSSDPATDVVVDPEQDAGIVDGGEEASDGDAADAPWDGPAEATDATGDAALPSVTVALYPTPAEAGAVDGGTDDGSSSEAVLMALAAGAGGLVVDLDWSQLPQDAEGAPDSWARLDAMASYLNQERRQLLLAVSVVNASADSRPAALQGQAWTSTATRGAMRDAIDLIYETFGQELAYVSFGMEVDRYLASHPTQAPAFVDFMSETLDYARAHPARPVTTSVGLTWSAASWSDEAVDVSDRDTLADASDAVMVAFYGLDETDHLLPPSKAVADLGALVESIEGRPVVLHRVAYSTSTLLGGSELKQSTFVKELLGMVGEHRDRVPFVGIAMLHDPAPEACLRFAKERRVSSSAELYAFWCSTGLRLRDGAPKVGFSSFLSAATGLQ